jgi:hypothetical protein
MKSSHHMKKHKQNVKGDPAVSAVFDRCQTPPYAVGPLLPYLNPAWTVWEPSAGEGHLVTALQPHVKAVIGTDLLTGQNFFTTPPPEGVDVIITNPAYSTKYNYHRHCCRLGLPCALLVPVDFIGAAGAQRLMDHHGAEIILMDKRVDFKMPGHTWEESSAHFATMWVTYGLHIGREITYATLNKPGKDILRQWDAGVTQLDFFALTS